MGQKASKDFKSLIEAAATSDLEKLKAAIEAGADVNKTVEELEDKEHIKKALLKDIYAGDTPLLVAVKNSGSYECVRLLIDSGADVNIVNSGNGAPLITAVILNNIPIVKLLIEAGANVNSKALVKVGKRRIKTTVPLNAAISRANVESLKILLDAEADVNLLENIRDLRLWFYKRPTLDIKIRCLQLLLTKGAHVNQPGKFWGSALESFLSFLGENESAMKGVILIMAAGEHGRRLVQVKAAGHNLRNECREAIRRHLLSLNNINMFVRVPQLPLPAALKSYLLYDVTLDEEYVTNDVSDDVDFICKKFMMRRFESLVMD